jgi:hypothetical protein
MFVLVLFLAIGFAPPALAELSVALMPSESSPAPVGTMIRWEAKVNGAAEGARLWYRFREFSPSRGTYRIVRDYGPLAALDWTVAEHEGAYAVEVSVRNRDTGEVTAAVVPFEFTSRVAAGEPVVSETVHPLVFLYSAPACAAGDRMRVEFTGPEGDRQQTPWKACTGARSMNFYLAGMRPQTQYTARHTLESGGAGPLRTFATREPQTRVSPHSVLRGPGTSGYPILFQGTLMSPVVATDVLGNLVWYYPGVISQFTRLEDGGLFWGIDQPPSRDKDTQVARQWDLVGMTVRETNSARLSEQVVAMGGREVGGLHHEAIRLPDGNIAVLAGVEQMMTDVQGPGTYNVLGDMIIVLNDDMQAIWFWDTFDHLDVRRAAVLGENCSAGGCPTLFLTSDAKDWVHGNAITYTPDGNLLYSSRHQDWVVKVHYGNGWGSGDVLWRLGRDGDFRFISNDPWPWFSHQHDAEFDADDYSLLSVFDNGNTRYASDNTARSRGQLIRLDELRRTATLVLNADLGAYAFALGSAQPLSSGTYHFEAGWILQTLLSHAIEVAASGEAIYKLQTETPVYRSFRMRDLYTAR